MFEDLAHLVGLVEDGLSKRGLDIPAYLQSRSDHSVQVSEDVSAVHDVQKLWEQIILADSPSWQDALNSFQGVTPVVSDGTILPPVLANTGFYKVLISRASPTSRFPSLPASANVELLCESMPDLMPLKIPLEAVRYAAAAHV